jgi:glutaredoxin
MPTKNVEIYVKSYYPFCQRALALLRSKGIEFTEINVEESSAQQAMTVRTGGPSTVPQIFIDGVFLPGGCDGLVKRDVNGELDAILGISE